MISRWTNVPGRYTHDYELCELVIEFTSTGFDDPGSMYGGPDNLGSEPWREDERLLKKAWLEFDDGVVVELSAELQQKLFDRFTDEVYEVELEECEP